MDEQSKKEISKKEGGDTGSDKTIPIKISDDYVNIFNNQSGFKLDLQPKRRKRKPVFTTSKSLMIGVAIVLSLSVLAIYSFMVLTQELVPRFKCATNLKGLGTAMFVYADSFNDKWPTADKWNDLLVEECDYDTGFRCFKIKEGPCNYAMNKHAVNSDIPENMVLIFESKPGWNQVGGPELLAPENHEGQGCAVLFGDLHSEFVKTEDLSKLKWKAK